MIKRLKNLLIEVAAKPLAEQRNTLDKALVDWIEQPRKTGELIEQVDDILVMGVRF